MGFRLSAKTLATVAVVGSVCLGLALLTVAWHTFQQRNLFLENAWPIRAHVVALQPIGGDLSHTDPVVSFTTFQGDRIRIRLPGADLSPGTTVNLLYDEEKPENVRINDYWHLWSETWAFGVAGGLLTFVPLVAIAWGGRRKRL